MKKNIYTLILILLNLVNKPLKDFYKKVKEWYLPMEKDDIVIWVAFAPFYWIIVGLVYLVGFPAGKIDKIVNK